MKRKTISPRLWHAIYRRDGWVCQYCGSTQADEYHIDHVIPVAMGGHTTLNNLVVACDRCNLRKHATVLVPNNLDTLTAGDADLRARIVALAQTPQRAEAPVQPRRRKYQAYIRLDEMMRARKVSGIQLHRATGLATSTISEWRTNRADRLDLPTLGALCTYFDCEVKDLLGWAD